MKLLCTASRASWFTVGREYIVDFLGRVKDDTDEYWPVEPFCRGYRTEFLEDSEFSVAQDYGPVERVEERPQEQIQHEALLAAVVQMADDGGIRDSFDGYLAYLRRRYNWIPDDNKLAQRAFLLALAYFAEEKSQLQPMTTPTANADGGMTSPIA